MAVEHIITTEWITAQVLTHTLAFNAPLQIYLEGLTGQEFRECWGPWTHLLSIQQRSFPRSILYQLLLDWHTLYLMQMSGKFYFQFSCIKSAPFHLVLLHKQDQKPTDLFCSLFAFHFRKLVYGFHWQTLGQAWIFFKSDQSATWLEVFKPAASWSETLQLPAFHKTSCTSFGC